MSERRAVFTGLGLLTPIGSTPEAFWNSLCAGTSGIGRIRRFDPSALRCQIAGEIPDFDPKKIITAAMKDTRKSLNKMAHTIRLGLCAAQLAMTDAGLQKGQIDPFRFGVEFGCVMAATDLEDLCKGAQTSCVGDPPEVDYNIWGREGMAQVPPLWMLKYLPNMPACHVSILFDAQGPNNSITSTDTAGLLALGEAFRLLARNSADFFLVGGCDSKINPVAIARHGLFHELVNDPTADPTTAIKPFDAARNGTVLGEGAAVFGLEELEFAQKRGAKILGELVGFASGFDKGRTGQGLAQVIRNALRDAKVDPADIGHLNAAARGSRILDAWEARAIRDVFGDVPVFAPKGHLGNSGAASGLIELAASVLALQHGLLPGTLNYTQPDDACPVAVTTGAPTTLTRPYAVKLSVTDLGQCAAVVVKRWAG